MNLGGNVSNVCLKTFCENWVCIYRECHYDREGERERKREREREFVSASAYM